MFRRTSSRSLTTSWPATAAEPDVGLARVQSMLIVVVFPAPLGPRKPNTSPVATSKSTPRTASSSPKRLTKPRTEIAAPGSPAPRWLFPVVGDIRLRTLLSAFLSLVGQDPVQRPACFGQR